MNFKASHIPLNIEDNEEHQGLLEEEEDLDEQGLVEEGNHSKNRKTTF
jgi:hypothetical protein